MEIIFMSQKKMVLSASEAQSEQAVFVL